MSVVIFLKMKQSEVISIGNDDESSDEKMMTGRALLNMFEIWRRKNSDWKWTKTDNGPLIYPFTENSGICDDLLSRFEAEPPSELSIF
jgi:hypothetical protein